MSDDKLNYAFDLPLEEIEDKIRYSLNGDIKGYDRIIPLRNLRNIQNVSLFKRDVFDAIIRNIPLRGTNIFPYADAGINVFGGEPKGYYVGQTFVYDKKLFSLMKNGLEGICKDFVMKGISKMPPAYFYGTDDEGRKAMGFYFPPFAEFHNQKAVLIDGSHRSFLCGVAGASMNVIHLAHTSAPLPFEPIDWSECNLVSEKPAKENRYRKLNFEYFRDLGAVGIDG